MDGALFVPGDLLRVGVCLFLRVEELDRLVALLQFYLPFAVLFAAGDVVDILFRVIFFRFFFGVGGRVSGFFGFLLFRILPVRRGRFRRRRRLRLFLRFLLRRYGLCLFLAGGRFRSGFLFRLVRGGRRFAFRFLLFLPLLFQPGNRKGDGDRDDQNRDDDDQIPRIIEKKTSPYR